DEGRPAGWSWHRDAPQVNLPGLTATQALTFQLAERYLSALMPGACLDELGPYFSAAAGALDAMQDNVLHRWASKIAVVPPTQRLQAPSVDPQAQRVVYEALLRGRQVQLSYQRRGETELQNWVAHPLGLVVRGPVTYLVATLFGYEDIVSLVLHRVRSANLLDDASVQPDGFDLQAYIAEGHLGFGDGDRITLRALFSEYAGMHLFETPLSVDQTLTPADDGKLLLRAVVPDTQELRWWLLGFGEGVEVLAPKALRRNLAETAAKLYRLYHPESPPYTTQDVA
ncbi:MAG TPA: WYL domain-containing protein, partial [Methylococcaceae bacterium]|nr:WYL domain-containing protein [Methylococcaceae bacterium]